MTRDDRILYLVAVNGLSFREVGDRLNLSGARVQQIYSSRIRSLRKKFIEPPGPTESVVLDHSHFSWGFQRRTIDDFRREDELFRNAESAILTRAKNTDEDFSDLV